MIQNHDRSGWIGASDTSMVMGHWGTKSFAKWWMVKLGISRDDFTSFAMLAGTYYEHPILRHIGVDRMDRQIKIRRLRLRVNLDGETGERIKEVKTYSGEKFKLSKTYWRQAQVEMFAAKKALDIVSYRLTEDDYHNYFRAIDPSRISTYPVEYDSIWVQEKYLPRLKYLAWCIKKGVWPNENAY